MSRGTIKVLEEGKKVLENEVSSYDKELENLNNKNSNAVKNWKNMINKVQDMNKIINQKEDETKKATLKW